MFLNESKIIAFSQMMDKQAKIRGYRLSMTNRLGNRDDDITELVFTNLKGDGYPRPMAIVRWNEVTSLTEAAVNVLVALDTGKLADQLGRLEYVEFKNTQWIDTGYNPIAKYRFRIKKVIFNAPATIVLWEDGTKTVVKCEERDDYDPEKGMAMAIAKKALGNQGNYYNEFHKYLGEYETPCLYPMIRQEFLDLGQAGRSFGEFLQKKLNVLRGEV